MQYRPLDSEQRSSTPSGIHSVKLGRPRGHTFCLFRDTPGRLHGCVAAALLHMQRPRQRSIDSQAVQAASACRVPSLAVRVRCCRLTTFRSSSSAKHRGRVRRRWRSSGEPRRKGRRAHQRLQGKSCRLIHSAVDWTVLAQRCNAMSHASSRVWATNIYLL